MYPAMASASFASSGEKSTSSDVALGAPALQRTYRTVRAAGIISDVASRSNIIFCEVWPTVLFNHLVSVGASVATVSRRVRESVSAENSTDPLPTLRC